MTTHYRPSGNATNPPKASAIPGLTLVRPKIREGDLLPFVSLPVLAGESLLIQRMLANLESCNRYL